jgi:hypothetical protein
MGDQNTTPPLSMDAAAVLEKMQAGYLLIGDFGDYGRPFRLMPRGAPTWANVHFDFADELRRAGRIRAVGTTGPQTEYEAI